jgi:general secretion pathway protein G
MMQRIRKIRAVDAGFTLIELLIVVVILGVLAGVVVFAVSNFNGEGVKAACKSDIKNVEIASEAYFAKANPQAYAANIQALKDAGYLKEVPPTDKYTISYVGGGAVSPTIGGTVNAGGADCTT